MTDPVKDSEPKLSRHVSPLAEFIRHDPHAIISEWIAFAKTVTPASEEMTKLQLEDHIKELLIFIADDLETAQSDRQQVLKSQGKGPVNDALGRTAELHAALRLRDGFDLDEMISEYRALRASVVKLWTANKAVLNNIDVQDLTRFNEAIDQAITESVCHYTQSITNARNIFLGILGHDLRTPLGATTMAADLLERIGSLNDKQKSLVTQITNCSARASKIVSDLLDLTRGEFGIKLPLNKAEDADLAVIGKELVAELQTFSRRDITLDIEGDTKGRWDKSRLGQIFSNLIANAVQYSLPDTPINVSIKGRLDVVTIEVHNMGAPIPAEKLQSIFDLLKGGDSKMGHPENMGLGLYITKRIVEAHEGTVSITSNRIDGTTFIIKLPRS